MRSWSFCSSIAWAAASRPSASRFRGWRSSAAPQRRHRQPRHPLRQQVSPLQQIRFHRVFVDFADRVDRPIHPVEIELPKLHLAEQQPRPGVAGIGLQRLLQFIRRRRGIVVRQKAFRRRQMRRPISPVDLVIGPHEHVQHHIVQPHFVLIRHRQRRPAVDGSADQRHFLGIVEGLRMPDPFLQIIPRPIDEPVVRRRRPGDVAHLFAVFAEVIARGDKVADSS